MMHDIQISTSDFNTLSAFAASNPAIADAVANIRGQIMAKPYFFGHEDDDAHDDEPHGSYDLSDDADALASAGHGMDEDHGMIGGDSDLGNEY